jgi:hypothetical protein
MAKAIEPATVTELLIGTERIYTAEDVSDFPAAFSEPLDDGEDPSTAFDAEGA